MRTIQKVALLPILLLCMNACGGGGGTSTTQVTGKKVTLSFSASIKANSTPSVPFGAVGLIVTLPEGVTVTSCSLTKRNTSLSLIEDMHVTDALNRIVAVNFLGAPIEYGPLADLTCNLIPGSTLIPENFLGAVAVDTLGGNNPVTSNFQSLIAQVDFISVPNISTQ